MHTKAFLELHSSWTYQKRHLLKNSPFEIITMASFSETDSSAFPGHTLPMELQHPPNTLHHLSFPIEPDSSMEKTSEQSSEWCYMESNSPRSSGHGSISSGLVCMAQAPHSKLLVSALAQGPSVEWHGSGEGRTGTAFPIRWPSCCMAPAFTTCCLQMP